MVAFVVRPTDYGLVAFCRMFTASITSWAVPLVNDRAHPANDVVCRRRSAYHDGPTLVWDIIEEKLLGFDGAQWVAPFFTLDLHVHIFRIIAFWASRSESSTILD